MQNFTVVLVYCYCSIHMKWSHWLLYPHEMITRLVNNSKSSLFIEKPIIQCFVFSLWIYMTKISIYHFGSATSRPAGCRCVVMQSVSQSKAPLDVVLNSCIKGKLKLKLELRQLTVKESRSSTFSHRNWFTSLIKNILKLNLPNFLDCQTLGVRSNSSPLPLNPECEGPRYFRI